MIIVSEKTPVHGVNLKIEFNVDSYSIRPESFNLLNELGKALTSEKLKEKDINYLKISREFIQTLEFIKGLLESQQKEINKIIDTITYR